MMWLCFFFFSSRRRHTRCSRDWSSDVCSSDLVALVPFESDVMSRSAYPERFSMNLIRSFPDAQVVAGLYHANGFGVRPAVVLRTAKQIELAHGHGHKIGRASCRERV